MPVDPHPLIVTCTECDAQYDAEDSPCPCCGSSSQTVDRYELADWQEANGDDPFPNEPRNEETRNA